MLTLLTPRIPKTYARRRQSDGISHGYHLISQRRTIGGDIPSYSPPYDQPRTSTQAPSVAG